MIHKEKIHNIQVHDIPREEEDNRPALGWQFFPEAYSAIFICAKKKSGKTVLEYNISRKCFNKKTYIIAFVSTMYNDANWKAIRKDWDERGIEYECHMSIKDDMTGENILKKWVEDLKEEAKIREEEEEAEKNRKEKGLPKQQEKPNFLKAVQEANAIGTEIIAKKERKSKYKIPEYAFIFDDISSELRSPELSFLIKRHRHFFSKIIISSQYLKDLTPDTRHQINYYILFKNEEEDKLRIVYEHSGQKDISFEKFKEYYEDATKGDYNFFYVDTNTPELRQNFDVKIDVKKDIYREELKKKIEKLKEEYNKKIELANLKKKIPEIKNIA